MIASTAILPPAEYHARLEMEVRRNDKSEAIFGEQKSRAEDPQFLAKVIGALRAPEVLNSVIAKLDLAPVFSKAGETIGKDELFARLNDDMITATVPNSGKIEVGIYNLDAQWAADIANTVFTTYRDRLLDELQQELERELRQLKEDFAGQQKVVDDAVTNLAQLAEQSGLVDPDRDSPISKITVKPVTELRSKSEVLERLDAYERAKADYLKQRKILEAAEVRLSAARMEKGCGPRPVELWHRAEPPQWPAYFHVRRRLHVLFRH